MVKYAAFLRAINVGKRLLKMDHLKKMFEQLKFKNVKTFINSGNVTFETSEQDKVLLTKKIEKKLLDELGFEVHIMLRNEKELTDIVKTNPYKNEKLDKDTRVYIAFLYKKPDKKIKDILKSLENRNEKFVLKKDEVYCLIQKNEKNSSYSSITILEKKLEIPLTTRNQNTVNKINDYWNNTK